MAKRGRPLGHRLSEESKKKIAESKTGYVHEKRTKNKISKTLKKYFIENGNKLSLPIGSISLSGDYYWIKTTNGWIHYHRYIVEQFIGRELRTDEIVHHKDFNKLNNKIYNLQIVTRGQHKVIHCSKNWIVIDKDGIKYEVSNLLKFCKRFNLQYISMRNIADGKTVKGLHKGYKCFRIDKLKEKTIWK